jgi:hypothetical protein
MESKFYNLFYNELAPILTNLFNESLRLGKMPHILKKHIKSLHKGKATRTSGRNYRPIGPISIISSTLKLQIY